jgi:hypothetical protein
VQLGPLDGHRDKKEGRGTLTKELEGSSITTPQNNPKQSISKTPHGNINVK